MFEGMSVDWMMIAEGCAERTDVEDGADLLDVGQMRAGQMHVS